MQQARYTFTCVMQSVIITSVSCCRFAQENDLIFLETSAKTGDSVEEAFLKCSKTILAKIETGELDPERIGSGKLLLFSSSWLFTLVAVFCSGLD
jgi:hypothetical protein